MSKAKNTTAENHGSVEDFIAAIEDPRRQAEARVLDEMMRGVTRREPKMWGSTIVGYGKYHYRYESGREGEFMITGWSPRKANLTVYVMEGFTAHEPLMAELGPHKTGKSCLYIRDLEKVDLKVLKRIVRASVAAMRKKYKTE